MRPQSSGTSASGSGPRASGLPGGTRDAIVRLIERAGVVAVIRLQDPRTLGAVIDALAEGGIRALEITMTVPGAIELIAEAAPRLPEEFLLGAGDRREATHQAVQSLWLAVLVGVARLAGNAAGAADDRAGRERVPGALLAALAGVVAATIAVVALILPAPSAIVAEIVNSRGVIGAQLHVTIFEVLAGYALAVVVGFVVAAAMAGLQQAVARRRTRSDVKAGHDGAEAAEEGGPHGGTARRGPRSSTLSTKPRRPVRRASCLRRSGSPCSTTTAPYGPSSRSIFRAFSRPTG